jgi:hypothetical protein
MAKDTDNVRGMSSGSAWVNAVGSTAPVDPTSAFAAGWAELGWIGEDGITEAFGFDTDDRVSVEGVLLRRVITGSEVTFGFRIEERNGPVWDLYYPGLDRTTATGITTAIVKAPTTDPRAFAFQLDDGDIHTRIVVAKGEISDRGDVEYKTEGYDFTMTCYPASDGEVFRILTDDPAVAAA